MSTLKCFDASTQIPELAPEGCDAVLGYVYGKTATHIWTLGQWLQFRHLRQFPAAVADIGSKDLASEGTAQAEGAVEAVAKLGWHKGRVIVCDMEAWHDPVYWSAWKARVEKLDYTPAWYGSGEYASSYPCDFKWLADPDGKPEIPAGYAAKQYAWDVTVPGGLVDLSVVTRKLFDHGGVGPRHG